MNDSNSHDLIPLCTLIDYHKVGFKLLPLCEDGAILNLSRLLTSEERQRRIDKTIDEKERIYNHPEFWTNTRPEKEGQRFKNVATFLGKIHLSGGDSPHWMMM
jgi:hypothetical protein